MFGASNQFLVGSKESNVEPTRGFIDELCDVCHPIVIENKNNPLRYVTQDKALKSPMIPIFQAMGKICIPNLSSHCLHFP
jgi:hypothetical protein